MLFPRVLALFFCALLLGACSSSSRTAENGYPVLPPGDVTVYDSLDDVPDEYEVVGSLQQYATVRSETRVVTGAELERIRKRQRTPESREWDAGRIAGEMGASGLLRVSQADAMRDPRIAQALGGLMSSATYWSAGGGYVALYVGAPPDLEADAE
jgi:hypothetical protein